jgi:PAS domain S-box-containing protein
MAKPRRTVLVIDSSAKNCDNFKRQLRQDVVFSYQFLTQQSSLKLLTELPSQPIDGILFSLERLGPDEFSFFDHLKSTLEDLCPPLIVVGNGDPDFIVQAFKHGATDYLVKGKIAGDDLCRALRIAIENAELKRQLHLSHQHFQASVECLVDCFGIFTAMRDETGQIVDFRIEYLNQAACDNNRMPREKQLGCGLCEVLPGHIESGLFDAYCHLVETGEPVVQDSVIFQDTYGGKREMVRAFDIRATKFGDGFVSSWRDITERKRIELQLSQTVSDLQREQGRLQRLIDTAPIGIGISNSNGEVKVVNDAMLDLHGYTREEFEQQGLNWWDFIPEESRQLSEQGVMQLRQKGRLPPLEMELQLRDGRRVPIWFSATQWVYSSDEHVSFAVDLTPQKQAEQALQQSEQRYRDLAEAMPQIVWTADACGAITYWNQRWYDYTGLSEAASMGLAGVQAVHPDQQDCTLTQWQTALSSWEPFEMQYRIRRFDGEYRWFICRALPSFGPEGNISGWLGTITDIEELRQAKDNLRRREQQLRQQLVERTRAEAALRQATERLDLTLKSAPIILFTQDRDLRYTWIYKPAPDFSAEDVIGRHDADLISPASAARLTALKQQVLQTGEGLRQEVEIIKDNVSLYYDLTIDPLWDDKNAIAGITCAAVDITHRVRLEQQRQEAEAQQRKIAAEFQVLYDQAPCGYHSLDKHGVFVQINETELHMLGYQRDEVLGKKFSDFLTAESVPTFRENFPGFKQQGWAKDLEFQLICKDGSILPISLSATGVYDEDGNFLRSRSVVVDISERKRLETERLQAETAFLDNEKLLRLALSGANAGSWAWKIATGEITWSAETYELFGFDPAEGPPSYENCLAVMHPDDRERVDADVMNVIEQRFAELRTEFRVIHPQRGIRWLLGLGRLSLDSQGMPIQFSGINLDITDQKTAAEQREQLLEREQIAREEAEKANRIKDEFLAILSHELRSPLNPILGWSKLLQTQKLPAEKTTQALETIERNAKLQAQLIDDLLDVARILRGKLKLQNAPVDLRSVLQSAMDVVKTAAEAKSIDVQLVIDHVDNHPGDNLTSDRQKPLFPVNGDNGRLQQVFWNLLSNAIKFTPSGGRVEIFLELVVGREPEREGARAPERGEGYQVSGPRSQEEVASTDVPSPHLPSCAQITVKDTGKGISADFLPHLFESFRQEDVSITRKFGGLGLGLAIVRYLVEAHGGTITADSPGEGLGATFTVTLPLSAGPATSQPVAKPPQEQNLKGIRVVTVDDDPDSLELLTMVLSFYGAEVQTFSSAADVLAQWQALQPDILLSDIGMPDIDGYDLIQNIRKLPSPNGKPVPAIAISAYAHEVDQQKALASGFQQHISKPLEVDQLVQSVARLVRGEG